jgi:nitroreductase/dihydropteridine reductase
MELLNALNWRYATKKMNGKLVAEEKVEAILEAARLAPSSSGLQPFQVIVISDPELKKQIVPVAMNQSQVADCSHLLVFAAWDKYTKERLDEVFARTEQERGLPAGATNDYKNTLSGMFFAQTAQQNFEHAARQAYISFGLAIGAAAELKVDATPMEGFDNAALDKLLGLEQKGLKSVTLLALGYREEEGDWLVKMKKVRTPKEQFLITT